MIIEKDDFRLTAYVLGELSDEERAEVETAMAEDDSLRAEVDAIRGTVGVVAEEFQKEAPVGLRVDQKAALDREIGADETPMVVTRRPSFWSAGVGVSGIAAGLLAGFFMFGQGEMVPTGLDGDGRFAIAEKDEVDASVAGFEGGATSPGVDVESVASDTPDRGGRGAGEGEKDKDARVPVMMNAVAAPEPVDQAATGSPASRGGRRSMEEDIAEAREQTRRLYSERMSQQKIKATEAEEEKALVATYDRAHRNRSIRLSELSTNSRAAESRQDPNLLPSDMFQSNAQRSSDASRNGYLSTTAPESPESTQPARSRQYFSLFDTIPSFDDEGNPIQDEPSSFIDGARRGITEQYAPVVHNPFLTVAQQPMSTFAMEADTASYSNIRRFLTAGRLPSPGAVRLEEMLNYFDYDDAPPTADSDTPFAINVEVSDCPWNTEHRLARIGLKGKEIAKDDRPATNLVFLLDVSGSMSGRDKLPLVKQSMKMLVENLTVDDRVAIVVYAGSSGLVLDSTPVHERSAIIESLGRLKSGGSTNGGAGIQLAYKVAQENFIEGGQNRVILCTDGDFNVGITDDAQLVKLIEEKRESGVFLNVYGFGTGNYKDSKMEELSNKGNGTFGYIDNYDEARHTFVEGLSGALVTIAKDVKIQVEFNPALVSGYRLLGYENRILAAEDFNDDTKDAGEIGAGHSVMALYEIIPAGQAFPVARPDVDELIYQKAVAEPSERALMSGELLTVKLRHKKPDSDTSELSLFPVRDEGQGLSDASDDFRFAAAVASFGMILRDSPYKGEATFESVLDLLGGLDVTDTDDMSRTKYRVEFQSLVQRAKALATPPSTKVEGD